MSLFKLLLVLLAGCLGATAEARGPGCAAAHAVPWTAVAPGVWVWLPRAAAEIAAANAGHVMATSVLISGREALVVDPGPSRRHGWRVRASLACRFGARVRYVINTHGHAENVLANAAFEDLQASGELDILASAGTLASMRERCPDCLASLTQRVGEAAMAGTGIVLPNRVLADGETLVLGRQSLQVMLFEQAHTQSDLALWRETDRLLWAGGLAYEGRVPELAQGSVTGWLAALGRLQALAPKRVIGLGVAPAALRDTRAYLEGLRTGVLGAMDQGRLSSAAQGLPQPAFSAWAGYAERQGFNTQRAWRELEPLWMNGAGASTPDVGR